MENTIDFKTYSKEYKAKLESNSREEIEKTVEFQKENLVHQIMKQLKIAQ